MSRAPVCAAAECCGSSEKVLRLSLVTWNVLFIGLALPGFALLCSSLSSVQSLGFGSGSRFGWVQTGLTVWFNRVSS